MELPRTRFSPLPALLLGCVAPRRQVLFLPNAVRKRCPRVMRVSNLTGTFPARRARVISSVKPLQDADGVDSLRQSRITCQQRSLSSTAPLPCGKLAHLSTSLRVEYANFESNSVCIFSTCAGSFSRAASPSFTLIAVSKLMVWQLGECKTRKWGVAFPAD